MSALEIALIAFAGIFGGVLLGMFLRSLLPEHHVSEDSRDVMKLGTGMIATMAALILSLLISSAKGTFDAVNNGLRQASAKIVLLDRTLARYGPETKEARDILRRSVAATIERIWPTKRSMEVAKAAKESGGFEELNQELQRLSARNEEQRRLQLRSLEIIGEISETRLLIMEHVGQSSFPMPLLVLLVCWFTIIFLSFGLLSSPNTTVFVVLFICALSAASALFLLLELDQPFGGLIRISSAPLKDALAHLGQQI